MMLQRTAAVRTLTPNVAPVHRAGRPD